MSTQFAPVWNNASVDLTCIRANVTNTNSGSGSTLLDLLVDGSSKFSIDKTGKAFLASNIILNSTADTQTNIYRVDGRALFLKAAGNSSGLYVDGWGQQAIFYGNTGFYCRDIVGTGWSQFSCLSLTLAGDAILQRDAANTLAQRRTTDAGIDYPQAYRIYNKFIDSSNYERGQLAWESNEFRIGMTYLGTGVQKDMVFGSWNDTGTWRPALRLYTNGTLGNIAIGVPPAQRNPYIKLEMWGASSNWSSSATILFGDTSGNANARRWLVGNVAAGNYGDLTFAVSSTDVGEPTNAKMTINKDGSVGIGTATPSYKLDILANSGGADGFRVKNTTAGATAQIQNRLENDANSVAYYGITSSTYSAAPIIANRAFFGSYGVDTVVWTQSANDIIFATNGLSTSIERMRITSSGLIGIGLTSPAAKLDISDTTGAGSGSLAASILNLTQTWNTTGTPTAFKLNVTDTASNAASLLMDLQVGGSSKFKVGKTGILTGPKNNGFLTTVADSTGSGSVSAPIYGAVGGPCLWIGDVLGISNGFLFSRGAVNPEIGVGSSTLVVGSAHSFAWASSSSVSANAPADLTLFRDAANTLALRRANTAGPTTYPQAFRLYNSVDGTDSAPGSNWERAKIAWSSNVLQIGTEKLGTGSARALELQTDGTTRLTIGTDGNLTIPANNKTISFNSEWLLRTASTSTFEIYRSGTEFLQVISGGAWAFNTSANATYGKLIISSGSSSNVLLLEAVTATGSFIRFVDSTTATYANAPKVGVTGDALELYTNGSKRLSISSAGLFTITDALNIAVGTTTGTKIGTDTTQKLGFWNAAPVAQPTTAVGSATVASPGAGSTIKTDDTFDGYTIQQVVKALRNIGILA